MKKYQYKYCVFTNNLRDGVIFLCSCDTLPQALNKREYLQYSGWGCCDIVKKRIIPGELFPINESIYNNYRYSEYDL
jgi:hypothetical protein